MKLCLPDKDQKPQTK